MKNFLPRAVLTTALFLFSSSLWAQSKAVKSETYRDIIEKAQNLVLQKDRTQAMNILMSAIHREPNKSAASAELKKTLNDISSLFFSDKAQQMYEVGITLKRSDLTQAQQKIAEAERLEPDNSLLLLEQARMALAKGECASAEEITTKARLLNMYFDEMNLAYAQATLCQGQMLEFQKTYEAAEVKKQPLGKFWQVTEVEKQFKEKNYGKAMELAGTLKKIDPQYPEVDYWIWKIDQIEKKKNAEAAERYVMSCKNISAHLYRQYMMDPMLCRRLTEVDINAAE